MILDIVMHNVPMMLSSLMVKPMQLIGYQIQMTRATIWERENMEHAVLKWIFGRQIVWPLRTHHILVVCTQWPYYLPPKYPFQHSMLHIFPFPYCCSCHLDLVPNQLHWLHHQ